MVNIIPLVFDSTLFSIVRKNTIRVILLEAIHKPHGQIFWIFDPSLYEDTFTRKHVVKYSFDYHLPLNCPRGLWMPQ